jgi:purine-nucleoside/S-methyl-5'-thioadenosine phosphorylase / adenosine deaminase
MEWFEREGVRWLGADLGGARAAFSTRVGGVSEAPFDSLNLGLLTDDAAEAVAENRRRLAAALGFPPERIAFARQVHGAGLISHPHPAAPLACSFSAYGKEKEQGKVEVPEGDGHVVRESSLAPLVFTADCLPVALAGPGGVAMLHCGWRGLAAGIVASGVAAVGATDAAIGPGIGPCCYEVGPEVLNAFSTLGPGVTLPADGPKTHAEGGKSAHRRLDLVAVARRLLVEAGVERVGAAGLCTSCEPELFFSHRRDAGGTGRQGGLAWIEA